MGTDCYNIEPEPLLRRIVVGILTQDKLCGVRHSIDDGNAPVVVVSILNVNLGAELYRILSTPQEWRRGSWCGRHWRSCRGGVGAAVGMAVAVGLGVAVGGWE